jgi:hypothetical protein
MISTGESRGHDYKVLHRRSKKPWKEQGLEWFGVSISAQHSYIYAGNPSSCTSDKP